MVKTVLAATNERWLIYLLATPTWSVFLLWPTLGSELALRSDDKFSPRKKPATSVLMSREKTYPAGKLGACLLC